MDSRPDDSTPTVAFPSPIPDTAPATSPEDAPAAVAASRGLPSVPGYEILGELGRGGMGVVYKARQARLNRLVALKMILSGGHAGGKELARFRSEAEAVARLHHPGVVQIYDVGEHDGLPFFSLELCPGGTLADRLRGTPLPERQSAELVEALARAVEAAHRQKVVHRDLKPANILFAEPASDPASWCQPKVTDFGLAKRLDETLQTATGAVMGTPSYMAPEQAGGEAHAVGPAADLYALGAILYECLTGRPPFKAATAMETVLQTIHEAPVPPRLLNRRVDPDLEKVVLKCLEKQPSLRYAGARELAEDLRRHLDGEPVTARSVNLLERIHRELSYSQHEAYLGPWGVGLMYLATLIFAAHLATSLLLMEGCPEWLSFWVPRAVLLGGLVTLFLRFRPHATVWPTNSAERLMWALWGGYLLTFGSVYHVLQFQGQDHLHVYGVAAAVSGLAWLVMGGGVWGGGYVIGGLFLLAAPLMAHLGGSVWSPFAFGVLWSAAVLALGLRYWLGSRKKG